MILQIQASAAVEMIADEQRLLSFANVVTGVSLPYYVLSIILNSSELTKPSL